MKLLFAAFPLLLLNGCSHNGGDKFLGVWQSQINPRNIIEIHKLKGGNPNRYLVRFPYGLNEKGGGGQAGSVETIDDTIKQVTPWTGKGYSMDVNLKIGGTGDLEVYCDYIGGKLVSDDMFVIRDPAGSPNLNFLGIPYSKK